MPQTDSSRRFRFVVALTCLSLLAAAFGVACAEQKKPVTPTASYTITVHCMSHIVAVFATGLAPLQDPLYVCPGDTISWMPDTSTVGNKRFSVEFETSPFQGGKRYCDDTDCPALAIPTNLAKNMEAHKYVLIVDKQVFDPHVIIVPGNVNVP
jgi:hypothetical protein